MCNTKGGDVTRLPHLVALACAASSAAAVLTFLLACILAAMVVLILTVAIVVGVAYGYNYSMAEFISLGKSDVTVFMRRGQFSDTEDREDRLPVFAERRRFDDVFPDGSAVDINNLTPDAAGKARLLADSWEQAKEARKYDGILSKFTPWRSIHNKENKETRSSPVTNVRIMNQHETISFDEENRNQDDLESSKSVITTPTIKSHSTKRRIIEKFKPPLTFFDEKNRGQDDSYIESFKSKLITTKTTKISPSKERYIIEKSKRPIPKSFSEKSRGQRIFYKDSTKFKTMTTKTKKKYPSTKRHNTKIIKPPTSTLTDKKNRDQDDFLRESTKSETVKINTLKKSDSTVIHIMEKFKPLYVEEDTQENFMSEEITQSEIATAKVTKKWPSTERRSMDKTKDIEEINQKLYNYNKTIKSNVVTDESTQKGNIPDIKIRVGSINFDIPEKGKNQTPGQSSDENEDYSESEEEERIIKAVQEEANQLHKEKVLQTNGRRIPDVKIRVGKLNYHTSEMIEPTERTHLITSYAKQFKTKIPDIKIRLESKDNYDSDKNKQITFVEPLEEEDYEEIYRKSLNEQFDTVDKSRIPDLKGQVQSKDYYDSDKNYIKTNVKPLEKENEEQIYRKSMNGRFDKSRTPDIKVRLQSKYYNESNTTNKENVVEPLKKDDYGEHIYRKSLNGRLQTVDKSRTSDTKKQAQSKYNNDNKKNVFKPMEEEDYDEQFDRKTLSWRFRTVDRIKLDDGATRHPYKMEQPPHPYREEDDDVMYKPV